MTGKVDTEYFKANIFIVKANDVYYRVTTDAGEHTFNNIFQKDKEESEKAFDVILREKGYFCSVESTKNVTTLHNMFDLF